MKKIRLPLLLTGTLPLFILAHFGHHLVTALAVPLLPLIRNEFTLNYAQAGTVIAAFSIPYGISQLPAGWLADRVGRPLILSIGIGGVALAGFGVGLSHTYILLLVFLAFMGILGGGYHPASPPLISASVASEKRSQALGWHLSGSALSLFLAPLLGVAIATALTWRGSYIVLSIPVLIIGVFLYIFTSRMAISKDKDRVIEQSTADKAADRKRRNRLVSLLIFVTFNQAIIYGIIAFVPLFLVDMFQTSESTAAIYLAVIHTAGFWAGPLAGFYSDRIGKILPIIIIFCLISGPVVFLLNYMPIGIGIGALLLLIGIIVNVRMPLSESYIVKETSEKNRSTVLGIYYFMGLEGGGVLTPVLGFSIDKIGFASTFTIAAIVTVAVTLLCSVWLYFNR
jgi:FSR family fosmidomycin resistance protein-like MFS transporter